MCCVIVLSFCNYEKAKPLNYSSESISDMQAKVYEGDTIAYNRLKITYLDYSPEQLLFWAMIMANKYDYRPAYLDVYYSLKDSYDRGGEKFRKKDELTRKILLEYLTRASEKGDGRAKELLIDFQK